MKHFTKLLGVVLFGTTLLSGTVQADDQLSYAYCSTSFGESTNLKWMNLKQLKQSSNSGDTLKDVYPIYKFLIDHFDSYALINADSYSLEKPDVPSSTYKIGKPGF